jgi:hypothetical protein
MSSMLEQAIVDATALKEAALKNAESMIVEKYSDEIKGAVESLLSEQPIEGGEMLGDLGGAEGAEPHEWAGDHLNYAAAEGTEGCECPDEDQEQIVTLDFPELEAAFEDEGAEASDMTDREQLGGEMALQEDEAVEETEEELEERRKRNDPSKTAGREPGRSYKEDSGGSNAALEEAVDFDAADLADILGEIVEEELRVHNSVTKSGWAEKADPELEHQADIAKAKEQDPAIQEEAGEDEDDSSQLEEQIKNLTQENHKYKEAVTTLKEKLDEVSLMNAKLHYTNRVLNSPSLNERQTEKIVESISKAGSMEEAKVIYETLQSAVGSNSKRRRPKSLSEAVTKHSSLLVSRRESKTLGNDPQLRRMRRLAGIKE